MSWARDLSSDTRVRRGALDAFCAVAFGQVYVATPYTRRAAPEGVFMFDHAADAAKEALEVQLALTLAGVCAVSPIVQAHAMVLARRRAGLSEAARFALDAAFWTAWCAPMLHASRWVYVPAIEGWTRSDGIRHEVTEALAANKLVWLEARD